VPSLTVTSAVLVGPPSVTSAAYDRLQTTVMRYFQFRKDFAPELQPRVRAVSACPMLPSRGLGAFFTIETDALLR
jgi:hypothetical protein